jgi:hypothetical protein
MSVSSCGQALHGWRANAAGLCGRPTWMDSGGHQSDADIRPSPELRRDSRRRQGHSSAVAEAAGKSDDFRVVPPATRSQLYAYMGNARVPRSLWLEGGNI